MCITSRAKTVPMDVSGGFPHTSCWGPVLSLSGEEGSGLEQRVLYQLNQEHVSSQAGMLWKEDNLQFCREQREENRGNNQLRTLMGFPAASGPCERSGRQAGETSQARESTRWMPRCHRPKKDAETGETFKGSCMRAMSLENPNGATPLE